MTGAPELGKVWRRVRRMERFLSEAEIARELYLAEGAGDLRPTKSEIRRHHSAHWTTGSPNTVLPAMFKMLGSEPFIPSKIEVEFVVHGNGAFFVRHVDTIAHNLDHGGHSRVFSAVYYFNALPKVFSGGVLRLYLLT